MAADEAREAREADGRKGHAKRPGMLRLALWRAIRDIRRMSDAVIEHGSFAMSMFMKTLGVCMVAIAHGLIAFVAYTYLALAWPIMEAPSDDLSRAVLAAPGIFLITNCLYNYWKTICGDPGTPPRCADVEAEARGGDEGDDAAELLKEPPGGEASTRPRRAADAERLKHKECRKCGRQKPPRTHHCSLCRRCVLKMDHHCPWVCNCVGFGNYRHFCLFMLFLMLSCLFVVCVFLYNFPEMILHVRMGRKLPGTRSARSCILMAFMICVSIVVAICILGGFHVYLVLTNQTTIEFQLNMMKRREARRNAEFFRNPYDLGRTRNFQAVFGPNRFCRFRWLFPYLALPATGDGFDFSSLRARAV